MPFFTRRIHTAELVHDEQFKHVRPGKDDCIRIGFGGVVIIYQSIDPTNIHIRIHIIYINFQFDS